MIAHSIHSLLPIPRFPLALNWIYINRITLYWSETFSHSISLLVIRKRVISITFHPTKWQATKPLLELLLICKKHITILSPFHPKNAPAQCPASPSSNSSGTSLQSDPFSLSESLYPCRLRPHLPSFHHTTEGSYSFPYPDFLTVVRCSVSWKLGFASDSPYRSTRDSHCHR